MISRKRITFVITLIAFGVDETLAYSTVIGWGIPFLRQRSKYSQHNNGILPFRPNRLLSSKRISSGIALLASNDKKEYQQQDIVIGEIIGTNDTVVDFVSSSSDISITTTITEVERSLYGDNILVVAFQPLCHRPLGCTIEESLAYKDGNKNKINSTKKKDVFVTKVVQGGFADQAGIQVGDVIIGATNVFGNLQSMIGEDIEKMKSTIASRPDDEIFQFKIARGTNVIEEHERVLVEILANPDFDTDSDTERGIMKFIEGGYYDTKNNKQQQEPEEECNPFDDADCLVDNLYSMWADMEDYGQSDGRKKSGGASGVNSSVDDDDDTTSSSAPKPWSVRSSPSGTWVRDPRTGEMRNIDQS